VLGVPVSRLAATLADLAARAMRALRHACRHPGVASGFIADLTRSPAELSAAFTRSSRSCSDTAATWMRAWWRLVPDAIGHLGSTTRPSESSFQCGLCATSHAPDGRREAVRGWRRRRSFAEGQPA
jgi:hypothetical protein